MGAMDDLGDELLSEILTRLPVETLIGLKVINKRWHSLISDPFFIVNQARHSVTYPSGLFHVTCHENGGAISYLSLLDDDDDKTPKPVPSSSLGLPIDQTNSECLTILASSNGLLLVRSWMNFQYSYYICSPTTMTNQLIPKPPPGSTSLRISAFGLVAPIALDPSSSACSHTYKVICVYDDDGEAYRFKIFTSDMKLWRDSDKGTISCRGSKIFTMSSPVYFRGALHWLRRRGDILAFHVEKEQSWIIEIPENINLVSGERYLYNWFGVAEDVINLFSISENEIDVWVLDDYKNNKWQIRRRLNTRMWSNCSNTTAEQILGFPVFYDGERLVLMLKDSFGFRFEAHIHNTRTQVTKTKVLDYWLDCCRKFVPHIHTLIGV